jgi:hypothetical protein
MTVRGGRLVLPDGMGYRVLVLPERETMTPDLLRKIKNLVKSGATVVGPRVFKSPGLSGYPECDAEVKNIADELWGDLDGIRITEHRVGKGRVVWKQSSTRSVPPPATTATASGPEQYGDFTVVTSLLSSMGISPDFESDVTLRYTHRHDGSKDIYLIANPSDQTISAQCTFRVGGKRPQLWDAVTGEMRDLPEYTSHDGRTFVTLQFEGTQSCFVVFEASSKAKKPSKYNYPTLLAAGTLEGSWDVSFDPRLGGPERIKFESLADWTTRPEEGVKYYSGTARYRKVFDAPVSSDRVVKKSARLWLDLGKVFNMARVQLNGRDLGVVWCAPWRVEITDAVQNSGNKLEIEVANLWPNRLIGDEFQPPDAEYGKGGNLLRWPDWLLKNEPRPSQGRYTFATWKHFTKDSPLLPSGLLGPVRIFRSSE